MKRDEEVMVQRRRSTMAGGAPALQVICLVSKLISNIW